MRQISSVCFVLLIALAATTAVAGGDDEERPWFGILPDPDGPGEEPEAFACRIVDARTGAPIEGARLVRTPEQVTPWLRRHDVILSVGTADADGIAHVPSDLEAWRDDCHWLVLAPGYGFHHVYGVAPEPEVRLERGVTFRGRVLDPMGRPAPDTVVEILGGCSHGTAAARAVTGDDGAFRIEGVPRDLDGQIWVDGSGVAADLLWLDSPRSLGAGGVDLVLDRGHRYEGRVVDLLGRPMADVVVRVLNEQRGPTAITDTHGRFVLEGAEAGAAVYFHPPVILTTDGTTLVDDAHPGVPMRVVLGPLGVVEEEATARVHVRAPEGKVDGARELGVADYALVNVVTGRGPEGSLEPDWDSPRALTPGTYRVVPASPFAPFGFPPREIVARAGTTTEVVLRVEARPRLEIEGDLPRDAWVTVAVPGASIEVAREQLDEVRLPAEGPATIGVSVEDRPPFFFRVGPTRDGVRRVVVELPAPRRVRLPDGAREASLHDGLREVYARRAGRDLVTDAWGSLTLVYADESGAAWEAAVEIPDEAGALIEVSPQSVRRARHLGWKNAATMRRSDPDARIRVLGPGEHDARIEERTPGRPFCIEGRDDERLRRLRGVAPETGGLTLRWGPVGIALRIEDRDGAPVDAVVLAAGEFHSAPEGRLTLRGFDPGPIRVVVGRPDVVGPGRELRLTLPETGTLKRTVVLEDRW